MPEPHLLSKLRQSRGADLAELAIGYGLVLAVIWTPNPERRILYWLAVLWILISSILHWKETEPNGFGLRGLVPSLWVAAGGVALFCVGIGAAAWAHTLHSLYGPLPVLAHIALYSVWALMQQFVLQVFVLLRLLRLGLPRWKAIATATAMFATAHIPNPVLVPAVLLWATISCLLYLRYRNLYTIAVAHALLGMCLALTIPNRINHHMRVGLGYVEYPAIQRGNLEIVAH